MVADKNRKLEEKLIGQKTKERVKTANKETSK